jgi:hypothetical protein
MEANGMGSGSRRIGNRDADMSDEGKRLISMLGKTAREGWSEAFVRAAKAASDVPLLPDHLSEQWDNEEWTW